MTGLPEPRPADAERGIARWTGWGCDAAGLMLLVMVVLVCIEILARTIAGRSTLVADEYSGYLFVWITLIGFAHALQMGAFLRVEAFVRRLSPRRHALADMLSAACGVLVSAVCLYATGRLALASWRFETLSIQASATPIWIPQVILPLGFLVLVLLYAGLLVRAGQRAASP
jgi:TRAP-type C4-dicarboxylate transport system permease small subunit